MSDFSLAYRLDPTSNSNPTVNQAELIGGSRLLMLVGHELQVRDSDSGHEIYTLEDIVSRAQASSDGNHLLSIGNGGISIWDNKSLRKVLTPQGPGAIIAAHFSPDNRKIISANNDHTASIWDAETGNPLYTLIGHHSGIGEAAFSNDQRFILTVGLYDREVRIWDTDCPLALHVFHDSADPVKKIAYAHDGLKILSMACCGRLSEWSLQTGEKTYLVPQEGQIIDVAYSRDRSKLLTLSDRSICRVWHFGGKRISRLEEIPGRIRSADFSMDGRFVIALLYDDQVAVWRSSTGKRVWFFSDPGLVRTAALSPNGTFAIVGGLAENLCLWNVQTRTVIAKLAGHTSEVWDAAFSNDGVWMATSGWDNTARLWQARGGILHRVLKGHYGGVTQVSFSPDSQKVLTASLDGTARLWDVNTGKELHTFPASREAIGHAIFSPDGQAILTYDIGSDQGPRTQFASADHNPRLWDAVSGRLLYVLFGHQDWVVDACFSPGGKRVATGSRDGFVREFAVNLDDLLKSAEAKELALGLRRVESAK
jgi:WD40 repeat protein